MTAHLVGALVVIWLALLFGWAVVLYLTGGRR